MIGERVKLAREACGLTQDELAVKAGIPQSSLSELEVGRVLLPADESIDAIATATGFPTKFFYLGPLPDLPEGNYRKLMRGASKMDKQVRARARQIVEVVQRAEDVVPLPRIAISPEVGEIPLDDIENLAVKVRDALRVGSQDPIPNLMRAVERAGVVVVRVPGEIKDHDSFSAWPDFGLDGRPLIILTDGHPGDRDRFNVAHELGHLVLHTARRGVERNQAELEAHRFAGALLLPRAAAMKAMRPPITLRVLMSVKATFGISMAASARRALDLKLIGQAQWVSLNRQLSARQWKKEEPVQVPRENPVLISKIVDTLAGEGTTRQRAENAVMPMFAYHAFSQSKKTA